MPRIYNIDTYILAASYGGVALVVRGKGTEEAISMFFTGERLRFTAKINGCLI